MTRHVNLLRDGLDRAAAHVHHVLRPYRGRLAVRVRPNGNLAVLPPHECKAPPEEVVGYYTRSVSVEDIAADLQLRLRELQAANA